MRRLLAVISFCAGLFCIAQGNAQACLLLTGAGGPCPDGGVPPSTTTWNPSDKDPGITLSGGNLVATTSTSTPNCSVTGYCNVRAIANHATGKYYYELVVTNLGGATQDENEGIGDSSASLDNFIGATVDSVGVKHGGGQSGASCPNTPSGFTAGDTVSVAVDVGAALVWFRTNAGNWNNDATANPATGTNGCSYTFTGNTYPFVGGSNDANTVITTNFGGSAYSFTPPSGFGNW